MIRIKRAYEPPARGDGRRILVDRLWPRGMTKRALDVDDWLKGVAPSTHLRQWFGHRLERWSEFCSRYRKELDANPAADIHGIGEFTHQKHWGCRGSLVIDARIKPHHASPLVEDPKVTERVNQLAAPGGPLHGII